jgi:hypothetical protein
MGIALNFLLLQTTLPEQKEEKDRFRTRHMVDLALPANVSKNG